jgi:hypothetical protein
LYCPRCDEDVPIIAPWRGWKYALGAWYAVIGFLVVLFPFYAFDYCVLLPSVMLIAFAGGPLLRFAREKPVCRHCSFELDPRRGGTAVRPRR